MGEEEEEVTQEAIGTRLWNPRGVFVLQDVPQGQPCFWLAQQCWAAAGLPSGSRLGIVLGPHCTRGAGHQLCTQKPDIGWRDGSAGQGAG